MANEILTVGASQYRGEMIIAAYNPPLRCLRITGDGDLSFRTVDDAAGNDCLAFAVTAGEILYQWQIVELVSFTGTGLCWS